MNAGERLCDDRLQAQVHRRERRMLAAGPLSVVLAADDESAARRLGTGSESRIHPLEYMLGDSRDVRAQRQNLRPGRHDVVGRDIVLHLEEHHSLYVGRQLFADRQRLDIRPADDFDTLRMLRRRDDHSVVDDVFLGQRNLDRLTQRSGVGDLPGQDRGSGDLRTCQVDLRVRRPTSALEVAVECADGHGSGRWGLTHTDARAARRFEDPDSRGDQISQCPVPPDHLQHLA